MVEFVSPGNAVVTGRWGTSNTKVASCLLTYGFRLVTDQPFTRIAHADRPGKVDIAVHFNPQHPDGSVRDTPQDFEVAWRHRRELDTLTGKYATGGPEFRAPLQWMRRALDARDWLLKSVIYTDRPPNERAPDGALRVPNDPLGRDLAACLIAHRGHLYALRDGVFLFAADCRPLQTRFTVDGGAGDSMTWCRKVITQQDALIHAIRKPDNTLNHWMRVGKQTAIIPENCPPSARQPLIRELYV